MTTKPVRNVVIVGTGPAGLTAAIYAARANLSPVIYAGIMHGGQLTTTTEVENFPGFEHGIMGPKLMQDMSAQAERFGTEIIYDTITKVDFSGPIKKLWTDSEEIHAKAVIISTGATAKTLQVDGEWGLMGRGVSTCATCDGFFFKGKRVIVVGGGDSAMEEANYLSKLCSEVILIHRRDVFKASPIMLDRARKNPKITFKLPFTIASLPSDNSGLTGVVLENTETGA
jgi:thioredoxin reductase (NADPH)